MKPQLLIPVFVLLLVSLACNIPLPSSTTPTPTLTPTETPTQTTTPTPTPIVITPTVTVCAYVENPGPVPPELEKRAQDAFAVTGLKGDLKVSGEGEYTCSEFHLRSVDFEFSMDIADLTDIGSMKDIVDKVKMYPVKEVLNNTNLGNFRIRFRNATQFCWWDDAQGCGPAMSLP